MTAKPCIAMLVALGSSLMALEACSSDSKKGGSSFGIEELAASYAGAACEARRNCFGPAVSEEFSFGVPCEESVAAWFADRLTAVQEGLDRGTVVYEGSRAADCLNALRRQGCDLYTEPAECTAMLDGKAQLGEPCANDFECAGGDTHCKVEAECGGVCARLASDGGGCTYHSDCAGQLYCNAATGRCASPRRENEPCSDDYCAAGLQCVGEQPTCLDTAAAFSAGLGEPCLGDSPYCGEGLSCSASGAEPVCVARVDSGKPCALSFPDMCPTNEYCKLPADSSSLEGVCSPTPKEGEPCNSQGYDDFRQCGRGLRCDGEKCVALQPLGAPCEFDALCLSSWCSDSGQCVAPGSCL